MPELLKFILLFIGAYLIGSVPLAYYVGKWARGIDIRQHGSGNVGLTNLMTVTSKWLGIPVLLFDLGKGMLPVYAAHWLGLPIYLQGIAGIGAIIGHNWPVFLGFNAGRGVLTTVGVAFAIEPLLTGILALLSFIGLPFHLFPVSAFLAILLLSVLTWFSSLPVISPIFIQTLGDERLAVALVFLAIFLVTAIRRLTVPLSQEGAAISRGELMVNRFLFDRDIRSRSAWIHRAPPKT